MIPVGVLHIGVLPTGVLPTGDAAWTLGVIATVLVLLVVSRLPADAVMMAGVVVLMALGVVTPAEGLAGFSNEGVITVAALFIVARGLQETGVVRLVAGWLLGRDSRLRVVLARLVLPAAGGSAFLNNTPIVAAVMPGVKEWAQRHGVPVSRLLLPLSYASILGGTCTLIGTSTNLVVAGMVEESLADHPGLHGLGMFDISLVGLPITLVGCALIVLLAPLLMPDRRPALSVDDDPREYTLELVVPEGSGLVGKSIEDAGLRELPNGFLAELVRGDRVLAAVSPAERLEAGDSLVFVGAIDAVVDLQRTRGLVPATSRRFAESGGQRQLVEAVVAPANPLVGRSIRDGRFRDVYGAVVLAVARDGQRIRGKLGDVHLRPGDVLLLETRVEFARTWRGRRDFHLVSALSDSAPAREERALVAAAVLAAMVIGAASGAVSMLLASLLAAGAMVVTGCCSAAEARRAVDTRVTLAIAAAFGLGRAMQVSGLDQELAGALLQLGHFGPLAALAAIYLTTMLLTELVTNNAAAVLAFPLALSVAEGLGVSPMPFVIAVMVAASASFLTPIGYQTNLMVYGPGGYRFTDYLRLGSVMAALSFAGVLLFAPLAFPF